VENRHTVPAIETLEKLTGAISGVATRYLARSDASTVAIFGAGVQGRSQLLAVSTIRPIKKAFIFDQ
jgi:alanine dehydrogenase